jgi:DNA repair exonuclease SbcCD ATPase subunit
VAVRCKFYTYSEEGNVVDLSGTERFSTNVAIQNYIGKYEDAISTFFSTQGNTNTFIESTNSNRKNLLNSLLNLSIFDSCY